MIIATLINPQIYGDNEWYENTLILTDDTTGEVVERVIVNFPWEMPDEEVEAKIKQMACDKYVEITRKTLYDIAMQGLLEEDRFPIEEWAIPIFPQDPQSSLRWDWPEGEI